MAEEAARREEEAQKRREALIATARAGAKPLGLGQVECVNEDRDQRFRWVITTAGLNWEVLQVVQEGSRTWTSVQGRQGVIWFDQLKEKPAYYRGARSSADREITLVTDNGRYVVYCATDRSYTPADYLEGTFAVLQQAIDSWKATYPGLARW